MSIKMKIVVVEGTKGACDLTSSSKDFLSDLMMGTAHQYQSAFMTKSLTSMISHAKSHSSQPQLFVVARVLKRHLKRSKESSLGNQKREQEVKLPSFLHQCIQSLIGLYVNSVKTETVTITSFPKRKRFLSTSIEFDLSKQNIRRAFNRKGSTSMCINVNQCIHGLVGNL